MLALFQAFLLQHRMNIEQRNAKKKQRKKGQADPHPPT